MSEVDPLDDDELDLTTWPQQAVGRPWELMLLIKCLGAVQDFSAWRGLGSLLLAGLVVAVVVIPLMIVIYVSAR